MENINYQPLKNYKSPLSCKFQTISFAYFDHLLFFELVKLHMYLKAKGICSMNETHYDNNVTIFGVRVVENQ